MKTFWKWARALWGICNSTKDTSGWYQHRYWSVRILPLLVPLCLGTAAEVSQLRTRDFVGAWGKRCVQGSVCMSTDWSTAGSLWRARGCFIGRGTEPWNGCLQSLCSFHHTSVFLDHLEKVSLDRLEGLSFTGKGFSTKKRLPKKPHTLQQ